MPGPTVADYHMHTIWSGHATGTMEEYVQRAVELGLPEMGFSPHLPMPIPINEKVCVSEQDMPVLLEEFHRLRKAYAGTIPIRLGGECDFLPGCEKRIERMKSDYALEYIIGSVHFIGGWAFDHPRYAWEFEDRSVDQVYREYFGLVEQAAKSRLFDVIGHLDLPKKFGHRPPGGCVEIARKAIEALAAAGMAFEINTAGKDKPVGEFYPSPDLAAECRRAGLSLVFGSDSHAPAEVGRYFADAVAAARSAGCTQTLRFGSRTFVPLP